LLILPILTFSIYAQLTDSFTDPRDGQVYKTVNIGDQWWMAENLDATNYSDGSAIQLVEKDTAWDALIESDKAYCYYNNSTANKTIYGALYTWAAAMNGASSSNTNPSGVQGVCPDGWHLPSDAEWKQLELYLGMNSHEVDSAGYRGSDEGGKLKETGTRHWASPNTGATNSTGFTAIPGGSRYFTGSFLSMGYYPTFWSSTETESYYAWSRLLFFNQSTIYRDKYYKHYGFSVRCLKD